MPSLHRIMQDEKHVRGLLSEIYNPSGVEIWMEATNRSLGGLKPIHLIAEGRTGEVIDAVERLRSGAM